MFAEHYPTGCQVAVTTENVLILLLEGSQKRSVGFVICSSTLLSGPFYSATAHTGDDVEHMRFAR